MRFIYQWWLHMLCRVAILLLVTDWLASANLEELAPSCSQLGCDQPGIFTEDNFKLPINGERTLAWISKSQSLKRMIVQNENYGCVGSSKVVVCPFNDLISGEVRHIMLNPETGLEYDSTGYETLTNVGMPIVAEDDEIFAVNNTHASLVDPILKRSAITELPTKNLQGMHSPIYLADLGFFVVFGNLSESHSIYNVGEDSATGMPALNLVTTFRVERDNRSCPWLPFTEATASNNRVYFYALFKDESTGIVAIDFMAKAPYFKKAWEVLEETGLPTSHIKEVNQQDDTNNCTIVPPTDPTFPQFPPVDLYVQMIATPDGHVVLTTPIGLILITDHGGSGEQQSGVFYGLHYLSLDTTPTKKGNPPVVWITAWPISQPLSSSLIAFNYTDSGSSGYQGMWRVGLLEKFGDAELNVTSRISSFKDSESEHTKILVFGVSVNITKMDSKLHTEYCADCTLGVNNVLMAIRTTNVTTDAPDVVWMARVPLDMHITGQVIGVSDKLVMYVSNGTAGNIIAFK